MRTNEEIETKIDELRKEYRKLGRHRSVDAEIDGRIFKVDSIDVLDQIEATLLKIDILKWVVGRGEFPCE